MVSPAFLPPPPPPPAAAPKTSLPMLYYGLIVVGTASIVLALYNLVVLRWCADRRSLPPERQNPFAEMERIGNGNGNGNRNSNGNGNGVVLPASFRYKKEMGKGDGDGDSECAVCLSAFEEGEEIRLLPRCRHAFHAQCIDMWLFSHADCPLCRAPLAPARRCGRHAAAEEQGSREVLIVVNPVVAV